MAIVSLSRAPSILMAERNGTRAVPAGEEPEQEDRLVGDGFKSLGRGGNACLCGERQGDGLS